MSKYSKKNKGTEQTKEEAMKIARGTQKPGQSKEQTKLIAQGIQKGIEQYKKSYSKKTRELDKKLNKAAASKPASDSSADNTFTPQVVKQHRLPWVLLILSWLGFVAYVVLAK